jgi:glycerol-3-phosphate acyltransferase PlsX
MRIAVDAMGGDRAPQAPVAGSLQAVEAFPDLEVVLVGRPEVLTAELERLGTPPGLRARLPIHPADSVVSMDEDPVAAVRQRAGASARVAAELLGSGAVQGVVNMGSTGAAVAAAQLFCERLAGVKRLGIAVPFPRAQGATIVCDCGANPDARPEHLHQYAIMAAHYARATLGVAKPRIGILSIGEEEHKGNRLVKETWERFRAEPIAAALGTFVGNVEPREFFHDRADVVVTEGFAGNVALKSAEGMAEYVLGVLKSTLPVAPESGKVLKTLMGRVDYAEYGGAPLLGVRGAYLIGHGRSDARAVLNALKAARAYVLHDVAGHIVAALAASSPGEATS